MLTLKGVQLTHQRCIMNTKKKKKAFRGGQGGVNANAFLVDW